MCVDRGSTKTVTNIVYRIHCLCYSQVIIASSPVWVFRCGCILNLVSELSSTFSDPHFQQGVVYNEIKGG